MAKVLAIYHSFYGHRRSDGPRVRGGRARSARHAGRLESRSETMPEEAFRNAGGKLDQAAPVAQRAELVNYDAIIFGTGTCFGNMTG